MMLSAASTYQRLPCGSKRTAWAPDEHRGALAPGAHEAAVGLELEHRVIAAIERDDIARGADGDAAHAAHDRVGGIVEKVLHQMKRQLRDRRPALRSTAAAFLRVHRRDGEKRNRRGESLK